jgi:bifunctional non-homologous end joining protein LigD
VKHQREQEFVVGGWLEGEGSRGGRIGALLIGYYDDGALRWSGRVGTGFTEAELDRLAGLLAPIAVPDSPFADRGLPRDAHYVQPVLVAQVRFTEWTDSGRVRHPAYLGLRDDKDATDVRRE